MTLLKPTPVSTRPLTFIRERNAGNKKVKVRWDRNGVEGWNNPANLREIKDAG